MSEQDTTQLMDISDVEENAKIKYKADDTMDVDKLTEVCHIVAQSTKYPSRISSWVQQS